MTAITINSATKETVSDRISSSPISKAILYMRGCYILGVNKLLMDRFFNNMENLLEDLVEVKSSGDIDRLIEKWKEISQSREGECFCDKVLHTSIALTIAHCSLEDNYAKLLEPSHAGSGAAVITFLYYCEYPEDNTRIYKLAIGHMKLLFPKHEELNSIVEVDLIPLEEVQVAITSGVNHAGNSELTSNIFINDQCLSENKRYQLSDHKKSNPKYEEFERCLAAAEKTPRRAKRIFSPYLQAEKVKVTEVEDEEYQLLTTIAKTLTKVPSKELPQRIRVLRRRLWDSPVVLKGIRHALENCFHKSPLSIVEVIRKDGEIVDYRPNLTGIRMCLAELKAKEITDQMDKENEEYTNTCRSRYCSELSWMQRRFPGHYIAIDGSTLVKFDSDRDEVLHYCKQKGLKRVCLFLVPHSAESSNLEAALSRDEPGERYDLTVYNSPKETIARSYRGRVIEPGTEVYLCWLEIDKSCWVKTRFPADAFRELKLVSGSSFLWNKTAQNPEQGDIEVDDSPEREHKRLEENYMRVLERRRERKRRLGFQEDDNVLT